MQSRTTPLFMAMLMIGMICVPFVALGGPSPQEGVSGRGDADPSDAFLSPISSFNTETVWTMPAGGVVVGGMAVGDVLPDIEGDELIGCDDAGRLVACYRSGGGWASKELWRSQGQLMTPVVGDLDPFRPGVEALVVGMTVGPEADEGSGSVTEVYRDDNGLWQAREVYRGERMMHGAALGDLDPDREGQEIIVTGFNGEVTMLTPTETGDWGSLELWRADGKARKGVIDDFDPDHPGQELVVVDKVGNVTEIYKDDEGWKAVRMWTDPGTPGVARVGVGDFLPDKAGKEVAVGGDSKNVGVIYKEGGTWNGQVIYTDLDKIRGVVVADVDPTLEGNELVTFGYSKRVVIHRPVGAGWDHREIALDTDRGHDLLAGDFDPQHPGLELAFCGYSRNITMAAVSSWVAEVAFTDTLSPAGLMGIGIGDLDPDREGNELVTVDDMGQVIMVSRDTGGWTARVLWEGQGQLITPVIGDFDPYRQGTEVMVVGMTEGPEADEGSGSATELYRDADGLWQAREIYRAERMLHGAAVGDLDPDREGQEIIVMGFNGEVTMLTPTESGDWEIEELWRADGKARKGVIDDFDPDHPGQELVVVDKVGNVTELYKDGEGWKAVHMWTDPGNPGVARCAVGDIFTDLPGKEVVVGGDSNNVALVWKEDGKWTGEVIFTDSDKIRGVAIADMDPEVSGAEVYCYGYSTDLIQLVPEGNGWEPRVLFDDRGRSHDLAVGDANPNVDGAELYICGYSKNLTMVSLMGDVPGVSISAGDTQDEVQLSSGQEISWTMDLTLDAGYSPQVDVSVSGIPDDVEYTLWPTTIHPPSTVLLDIIVPSDAESSRQEVTLTLEWNGGSLKKKFWLNVTADTEGPNTTLPTDKDMVVDPDRGLEIVFDEGLDPASVDAAGFFIETDDGDPVTFQVIYDEENRTLIFSDFTTDDGDPLEPGTELVLTGQEPLRDLSGNAMDKPLTVSFVLEGDGSDDDDDGFDAGRTVVVVILLVVVLVVFFFLSFKRSGGRPEGSADEKSNSERAGNGAKGGKARNKAGK